MGEAIVCIGICRKVNKASIFRRRKEWKKHKATAEAIVEATEAKIRELRGGK